MPARSELILILGFCLLFHLLGTHARPSEQSPAKPKRDAYDWFSSILGDYFDDSDGDSEEILICRNCTVVIDQKGPSQAAETTAAPVGAPAVAPTAAPAAPPAAAPGAPPPAAPAAPPAATVAPAPADATTAAPAAAASEATTSAP
ncbi:actin cytoskeleton-regulatory complex protein pan1 [Drosophila persimilis]|uniref:actin cytoskeleton-regulatory complex protein pan1 n=1 Tax=Drosophila persimilis TaxID=7234 RepID=UPI000F09679D|nr:actin cytoskeleton-regulatory complex protein pan1 [Drosophila persimilis]